MDALYILLPIAVILLATAVRAFFWAVDHDQFEDLDREGARILFEDPSLPEKTDSPADPVSVPGPSKPGEERG